MGAGASAPAGVGSSPAPIGGSFAGGYPAVVPPASTPIATPTATPSSTPQGGKGGNPTSNALPEGKPFRPPLNESGFGDPRGFNNGATPALNTQASSAGAAALGQPNAPTAPQQPYVNPYMQTYGQNRTPQQQMFNRFPQSFRQPQPVAQPAQGPVYADQSLNAPGNQPQQQPQYGRFGRGFMPQNRFGYDRQLDQLRGQGQYGQQYPQKQLGFMSDLMSGREQPFMDPAYNGPTQAQWGQMKNQPATGYEAAPSLGGQAPAGGKGGNPTATGSGVSPVAPPIGSGFY